MRRLSQALGYTRKKAKKLLGKACPLRQAHFIEQLSELLEQTQEPDGPLLLFGDEALLHLDTDLGWGWAPKGQRLYVNSTPPPLARKLTCFGFYALGETESVRIGTMSWANGDTTCQRLRALKSSYPHRPLVLIWAASAIFHRCLYLNESQMSPNAITLSQEPTDTAV